MPQQRKHPLAILAIAAVFSFAAVAALIWLRMSQWIIVVGMPLFIVTVMTYFRLIEWKEKRAVRQQLRVVSPDHEE